MKKLLLLFFAVQLPAILLAYPITPRPLRKLVIESEYIVWAHVVEVGSIKNEKNDWNSDYAKLVLTEILQGKGIQDTITVYFTKYMICPQPGVFFKGEQVLAFLDKRPKKNGYEVHALSYGVKHNLGDEEYRVYKSRIREMQALDNKEKYTDQLIEWLVKCAEVACTRWDGLTELSYFSESLPRRKIPDSLQRYQLNFAQRARMLNALLEIDTLEYNDVPLAGLATGVNDCALLPYLRKQLTRSEKADEWTAATLISYIAAIAGDEELTRIHNNLQKVYFSPRETDAVQKRELMGQFMDRLKKISPEQTNPVSSDPST